MSKSVHQAEFTRRLPPPGGWTLMEAFEALCPQEANLYKQGASALTEVLYAQAPINPWTDLKILSGLAAREWIAGRLIAALSIRSDLELTGHDVEDGLDLPRRRFRHTVFSNANRSPKTGAFGFTYSIKLLFESDGAYIHYDLRSGFGKPPKNQSLTEVRIEEARASSVLVSAPLEPGECAETITKPTFSSTRCCSWFELRVKTWPSNTPPPSGAECLIAARAYFADLVPRDLFRSIRRTATPDSWQKPGPRGPRD